MDIKKKNVSPALYEFMVQYGRLQSNNIRNSNNLYIKDDKKIRNSYWILGFLRTKNSVCHMHEYTVE